MDGGYRKPDTGKIQSILIRGSPRMDGNRVEELKARATDQTQIDSG